MSTVKAILIGILIWTLGASFYTISYFFPLLENIEFQANLVLALALIPIACLGAKIYYKKGSKMHGIKFGLIVLFTSILLDALITVPYFIIPYGGSYLAFFGGLSFWIIAVEYLLIVFLYWNLKVKTIQS